MNKVFNFISGTLLTGIVYLLGGYDVALTTLMILLILDYITGLLKAIWNKKLNSEIGVRGIVKKVGYLIIVAISVILDQFMGDNGNIRNIVIYFFVTNECISIVENWGAMGLPLPSKLIDVLEQLKSKK